MLEMSIMPLKIKDFHVIHEKNGRERDVESCHGNLWTHRLEIPFSLTNEMWIRFNAIDTHKANPLQDSKVGLFLLINVQLIPPWNKAHHMCLHALNKKLIRMVCLLSKHGNGGQKAEGRGVAKSRLGGIRRHARPVKGNRVEYRSSLVCLINNVPSMPSLV